MCATFLTRFAGKNVNKILILGSFNLLVGYWVFFCNEIVPVGNLALLILLSKRIKRRVVGIFLNMQHSSFISFIMFHLIFHLTHPVTSKII